MALKWGQTPWDNMSREELLREVQRMFAALTATRSVVAITRHSDPQSPYWSDQGTGGQALLMADEALGPWAKPNSDGEDVYRAFFRCAIDLLFKAPVGPGWMVCETCDEMLANRERPPTTCLRGHPMRKLEWRDLEPRQEAPAKEPTP